MSVLVDSVKARFRNDLLFVERDVQLYSVVQESFGQRRRNVSNLSFVLFFVCFFHCHGQRYALFCL